MLREDSDDELEAELNSDDCDVEVKMFVDYLKKNLEKVLTFADHWSSYYKVPEFEDSKREGVKVS